jgi:hypothetical protein
MMARAEVIPKLATWHGLNARASGAGDRIDTVDVGAAVPVAAGQYRTTLN